MRMRLKRKLLVVVGFLSAAIYIGVFRIKYVEEKQVCFQPKLNPFEGDFYANNFHSVQPIKCSEKDDWIVVLNGTVFIDPGAIKRHGEIRCIITYFERTDDFENKDVQEVILTNRMVLPLAFNFFKAKCTAEDGWRNHNVHAGVIYYSKYDKKLTNPDKGYDVLMIGFNSVSHMTFIRKLKKTYKYFTENLGGSVLNGYNIIGDGTTQALLPILTGKTEFELTLKDHGYGYVDFYPWIWRYYRQKGYVTAFAEDYSDTNQPASRMVGFQNKPTDHYMRPFYVKAKNEFQQENDKLCIGSKRRSEVFMDWIKGVFTMYKIVPKFVFGFQSEVSHNDVNNVETADDDLYNLLKFLNEGQYIRNTIVILMSNRGTRFSVSQSSLQEKQEERLPFLGFSFPKGFKSQHSEAFNNFQTNVDRLTSPFDIYSTLLDIINFNGGSIGSTTGRGISLFKTISKSRTCETAGIEKHWCACLS